jgi:multidrug efflux pump subunit AcrB
MMWIVILALKRPYTFVCASLLIFIFGIFSILHMAVDVFAVIQMPVATVVWYYTGLAPEEMERRMTTSAERFYSSVANDIEHLESSSYNGLSVIKIYFQPDADVAMGVAEITAASQAIVKIFPPGATPPTIVRFNATDVPIVHIAVSSPTMPEDVLNDYGNTEQFRGYFPSFIDDAQHFLNDRNMEHRGQRGVTLVLPFFGPFARTVPKR